MKKAQLYAASALLSVFMLSGLTQPSLAAATATTETKAAVQADVPQRAPRRLPLKPLSEEKMKLVDEAKAKMTAESKPLFEQTFKLRKEMHDLLVAEKFDEGAYMAKHAEAQKMQSKIGELRARAVAEVAPKLTAEERAGLPRLLTRGKGKPHGGDVMMKGRGGKGPMGNGAMSPDMPAEE